MGTVSEARTAAELGASVVVAQGREAGGHGLRYIGDTIFVCSTVLARRGMGFQKLSAFRCVYIEVKETRGVYSIILHVIVIYDY